MDADKLLAKEDIALLYRLLRDKLVKQIGTDQEYEVLGKLKVILNII